MRLTKLDSYLICLIAIAVSVFSLAHYARESQWLFQIVGLALVGEVIFFLHYIPTKGRLLFFGSDTGEVWNNGFCFVFTFGSFLSYFTFGVRLPWDVVNYEEDRQTSTNVINIQHDYDQSKPSYNINTNATLLEMETHRFISFLLRVIFISWVPNNKFFNNGVGFRLVILAWVLAYMSNHGWFSQKPTMHPYATEMTTKQQEIFALQEMQLIKSKQGECLAVPARGTSLIEIDSLPVSMENIYDQLDIVSNGVPYRSTWEWVQQNYPKDHYATIVLKTSATDAGGKICF